MNEQIKRKPCESCGLADRAKEMRFCPACLKVERAKAKEFAKESTPIDYKPRYATMRGEKCISPKRFDCVREDFD